MKLLFVTKSNLKGKKKKAVFVMDDSSRKTVHFGGVKADGTPYTDYTRGASDETRKRYIERHKSSVSEMRATRRWKDPTAAGTLSRYLLWEHKSFPVAVTMYKRKFKI